MKYKMSLVIVVSLLLATAVFAGEKIAVKPSTATVFVNGPVKSVQLDGFCNQTPCNLKWSAILSDSEVGYISNKTGPTTMFFAGSKAGTAIVFLTDDQGHSEHVIITVE